MASRLSISAATDFSLKARITSCRSTHGLSAMRMSQWKQYGFRITRALSRALKLKVAIVILDAARAHPFAQTGQPLAGGLAMMEPEPGMLIAFNAAPGTVAPATTGSYGPYAQAVAEMMREGGLPLAALFDRVRLRVNDVTRGGQVPWHASNVEAPFVFLERTADAPAPVVSDEQSTAIRSRPIHDLDPKSAYIAALERDTLRGYLDFLDAYPDDPMAKRVRAIVAARREAMTWWRTRRTDTPDAYWSYLTRYPRGAHAADAHRRLAFLRVSLEPPPQFSAIDYDIPAPPPEEIIYVERPVLFFGDPAYDFSPPPPPPAIFLPPPPPEFMTLPPPPLSGGGIRLANAGLHAGSGLGSSAALRAAAAPQQRDLCQHPQQGGDRQGGEDLHGHRAQWTHADDAAGVGVS